MDDIAEMLRYNTTITNLVISDNGFTDRDAALIAQVIEVRKRVSNNVVSATCSSIVISILHDSVANIM